MACFSNTATTTTVTQTNNGTIAQLLKRIDQMQKEAIIANAANQCDNCMMSAMYNTKPISLINCANGEYFTATAGIDGPVCTIFRVEEVRNDETVVLRLLSNNPATADITCTTFTVVLRINCIGAVQCFDPINCETLCQQLI